MDGDEVRPLPSTPVIRQLALPIVMSDPVAPPDGHQAGSDDEKLPQSLKADLALQDAQPTASDKQTPPNNHRRPILHRYSVVGSPAFSAMLVIVGSLQYCIYSRQATIMDKQAKIASDRALRQDGSRPRSQKQDLSGSRKSGSQWTRRWREMDSNPRSPVRETDLARSPGSCPVGPFSELIYTNMVVIIAESPVNREYPNRHAARRDQFPHSASPAQSFRRTTSAPDLPVWSQALQTFQRRLSWERVGLGMRGR